MLLELPDNLDDCGVTLTMARVRSEIRDELDAAGITGRLAGTGIYLEVDDGVAAYQSVSGRDATDC